MKKPLFTYTVKKPIRQTECILENALQKSDRLYPYFQHYPIRIKKKSPDIFTLRYVTGRAYGFHYNLNLVPLPNDSAAIEVIPHIDLFMTVSFIIGFFVGLFLAFFYRGQALIIWHLKYVFS